MTVNQFMQNVHLVWIVGAKASGIPYKHKGPGFPIEIIRKIKPVYERLTDKLHGKTQNVNKSFNGMI